MSVPKTLSEVLAPFAVETFLNDVWGKQFLHIRGCRDKFVELLPWSQLNAILAHHRLDWPQIRLVREGKKLPPEAFIRCERNRRGIQVPHLRLTDLNRQLRDGAVLIIDAVDEMCKEITELAVALERTFRERVQVNAYAGWRASQGFDAHWDDHDVMVVQVSGKKLWSLHGVTRPYPLYRDVGEQTEPPPDPPLWQEVLEAGDLLYIPRGWWHQAVALDEPTLHLTCAVTNRTGIDIMEWLADELRTREIFRMDLPRFATHVERAAHMERLRQELHTAWTDSLLEQYFRAWDAQAHPRPYSGLPWSAMPETLPPDDNVHLRLVPSRPSAIQVRPDHGTLDFTAHGKEWRFTAAAEAVLRPLLEGRYCTIAELCELAADALDRKTVRMLLGELVIAGLVAIVE